MLNFFKLTSLANITTTNPIYSQSVIIFTIIDIIATFLVGMTTLLAPNISVQVFKKEPTMVILFIILMLMIILSFRPLRIRPTYNLFRIIFNFFVTLVILYTTYTLCIWYTTNVEGTFSYRFLVLTKKASLDDKLSLYNLMVSQIIDALRATDNSLATFLEKAPSIYNTTKLSVTAYKDIPILVEQTIMFETANYKKMISNITATTKTHSYSPINFWTLTKWVFVGVATIAVVYCLYSVNSLGDSLKKGLEIQKHTQTEMIEALQTIRSDAILNAGTDKNLASLSGILLYMNDQLHYLTVKVTNLSTFQERAVHLINAVIRPSIQATFVGIKDIKKETANTILSSLNEEQRRFITATSSIIFNNP
jgi:hypothetical protein